MAPQSSLRHGQDNGPVTTREPASPAGRGRLGVYAAIAAWAGALPIPWVPDLLARSVRGALVHDIAVRHGVSLAPEAREILARPSPPGVHRGWVVQVARFVGLKIAMQTLTRIGPVGLVWPASVALGTFALGHLFDRYLASGRSAQAVRIDEDEARRVRKAVDGATVRAFGARPARVHEPAAIDDQRDAATTIVDTVLSVAAGLPGRALDHLDAAFDELLARGDG